MANKELFHDLLKNKRMGMSKATRKKTKHPKSKQVWLYPFQWERKYAKEISALQKLFTKPLTKHLVDNLPRWIDEYNESVNTDSIETYKKDHDYVFEDILKCDCALWEIEYLNDRLPDSNAELKVDSFNSELKKLIKAEQKRLIQVYGVNAPKVRAMISGVGKGVS